MKEQELFELIQKEVPDLKRTENESDYIHYYTDSSVMEIECKAVNYSSQMIEKEKFNALIEDGRTPYYIVNTSKKILLFRLAMIPEPEWEVRWLPTKTLFSDVPEGRLVVGFIPNTLGQEIVL